MRDRGVSDAQSEGAGVRSEVRAEDDGEDVNIM